MKTPGHAIGKSIPDVFSRSTPVVPGDEPLVVGASLLRFHPIEAALLVSNDRKATGSTAKQRFIGGYSILAGLVKKDPREYYNWLYEPCVENSVAFRSLNSEDSLGDLLDLFKKTRFGFAAIAEGGLRALVGLTDMLRLYEDGTIKTELLSKDVASRPFRTSPDTTLKSAVGKMFQKRVRKLMIEGGNSLVSDREIISFIFSPRQLESTRKSPRRMLAASVDQAKPVAAEEVGNLTPLRDAARLLLRNEGNTLICEQGIVTPWDVVMKPWAMGRLVLG